MHSAITEKARLAHMDLLKCLAIYLVLVFHGTLYSNVITSDMSLPELFPYFFRTILSTCVPLFFFVNGYLLLSKPLNLKKHTFRVLQLMAITCFWILFLLMVNQPFYGEYHTWEDFWQTCWNLRGGWNNQLWYMGALITIYLVFPLLKSAYDQNRSVFYWFTAVTALLVFGSDCTDLGVTLFDVLVKKEFFLYYNNLPFFHMFNPFSTYTALGLAYFCIGGTVRGLEQRLLQIPGRRRCSIAGGGLLISCTLFGIIGWRFSLYRKEVWDPVWYGYDMVFTLINVLCLYVLSLSFRKDIPFIRLISSNTLGIYLIHDLVHKALSPYVIPYAFMRTLPGTLIYAAALLLISLGLSLVLKKIPLVKHLI